jgi:phosphonate transport system permease protein
VSETLREFALRDLQGLRARHRTVFATDWRRRVTLFAGIIVAVALAGYGFWRLDFSLGRLGSGVGQIAHMVSLMFPPSPGGRLPL